MTLPYRLLLVRSTLALRCSQRMKHPRTGEVLDFCGYHTKHCLGNHAGDPPTIEVPNKHGLSLDLYRRKFLTDPPSYRSALQIPGVVFFKAATNRHPMAPEEAPSDSDSVSSSSSAEVDPKGGSGVGAFLRGVWRRVRQSGISKQQRHEAAARIQGMYRICVARRVVHRMVREDTVRARQRSAIFIQRLVRAKLEAQRLRRDKAAAERAVRVVQKNYRLHKWRREVKADRLRATAAQVVQQWWRRRLALANFRVLRQRLSAKLAALAKARGRELLERFVLGFVARRRCRQLRRQLKVENFAARVIQRFMVSLSAGSKKLMVARMAAVVLDAQEHIIAARIQRCLRRHWRYKAGKGLRKHMVSQVVRMQCLARRFLARCELYHRKVMRESAWAWLQPALPRGWYEKHLAFPDYERMFGPRINALRVGGRPPTPQKDLYDTRHLRRSTEFDPEDAEKALTWISRLTEGFKGIDKQASGLCTKLEFWRVLESHGIRLKPEFKEYLAEAFVNAREDKVSWLAYCRFGRSHPFLCPLHRVPICPECLFIGPCPDSGCKEFVPLSTARQGDSAMCACGFHISRHRPALRTNRDLLAPDSLAQEGTSDTRSLVARFAFQEQPEFPRPVTPPDRSNSAKGVVIESTDAYTTVNGVHVRVRPVPASAITVSDGKTLKELSLQRQTLQSFLRIATESAMAPYKHAEEQEEKEKQRHEFLSGVHVPHASPTRTSKGLHGESGLPGSIKLDGKRKRRPSKQVKSGRRAEPPLHSTMMTTLDATGTLLAVTRSVSAEGQIVCDSGADGSGLAEAEYIAHAQEALRVPLPSGRDTGHFRDLSACAAASEAQTHTAQSMMRAAGGTPAWLADVRAAKGRELAMMKVPTGDLVPGITGAGKGAQRLPFESQDGVGPGGKRGFRLSRPVMHVSKTGLNVTADATLLYLMVLRSLSSAAWDGYDLLADERRCVKFLFDHHSFIDQHWEKLVKDVRYGTLSPHLNLDPQQRSLLEQSLAPSAQRADTLQRLFSRLGYVRRASRQAASRLPAAYLKASKGRPEDPAVLQRKFRIANRERFRHGPSSKLPTLPAVYLEGHGPGSQQAAKAGPDKSKATSAAARRKAQHRSRLADALGSGAKLARLVAEVKLARQAEELAIPTVTAKDPNGTEFEFGYVEGASRPYIDLHPASGATYTSLAAAVRGAKRHARSHLRSRSSTDHLLTPTWKAAGVDEWPGQEVLPAERTQPIEAEVRALLRAHFHREHLDPTVLQRYKPTETEGRLAATAARERLQRSLGNSKQHSLLPAPRASGAADFVASAMASSLGSQLAGAVTRSSPDVAGRAHAMSPGGGVGSTPNANSALSFATFDSNMASTEMQRSGGLLFSPSSQALRRTGPPARSRLSSAGLQMLGQAPELG